MILWQIYMFLLPRFNQTPCPNSNNHPFLDNLIRGYPWKLYQFSFFFFVKYHQEENIIAIKLELDFSYIVPENVLYGWADSFRIIDQFIIFSNNSPHEEKNLNPTIHLTK